MVTAKLIKELYELQNVNPSHPGDLCFAKIPIELSEEAKPIGADDVFKYERERSTSTSLVFPNVTTTTLVQVMHNSMFKWGYAFAKDAHSLYKTIKWSKKRCADDRIYHSGWTLVPLEIRFASRGVYRNPFIKCVVVRVSPNDAGDGYTQRSFTLGVAVEDWHSMWRQYYTKPAAPEIVEGLIDTGVVNDITIANLSKTTDQIGVEKTYNFNRLA